MTSEKYDIDNVPSWFTNAELLNQYSEYDEYEYIDLVIQVSKDKSMFNATNLMNQMKDKANMKVLLNTQKWTYICDEYSNEMKYIVDKRAQSYNGYWFTWALFDVFVESVITTSSISFKLGRSLTHYDKGYIYMCKPKKCIGTNTYKFGKTWCWNQRVKNYGEGTQLIYLLSTDEMSKSENHMLNYMRSFLIQEKEHGDEYFKIESNDDMIKVVQYFESLMREENIENIAEPISDYSIEKEIEQIAEEAKREQFTVNEIVDMDEFKELKRFPLISVVKMYKVLNNYKMIKQGDVADILEQTGRFKVSCCHNKYFVRRL